MENFLTQVSEESGVISSLFPIGLKFHVLLALLAFLIFGMQFVRYRKVYYLLLTLAFPCTLLPYVMPESTSLFNAVGMLEFFVLAISLVLSLTIEKDKSVKNSAPDQKKKNQQIQEQQEEKA